MKNILIVGAGGIGSWLAAQLYHLNYHNQLQDVPITFCDDDTVDTPNLTYQNFIEEDFMEKKVNCLMDRYGFTGIDTRVISASELNPYTCIVSCVDNAKFRNLLFNWAFQESNVDKHWIDLRSEGNSVAAFCKHKSHTLESMVKTLGKFNKDADVTEGGSCQRAQDLNAGIVQVGNRIIASIGAQYILNYIRHTYSPGQFVYTF